MQHEKAKLIFGEHQPQHQPVFLKITTIITSFRSFLEFLFMAAQWHHAHWMKMQRAFGKCGVCNPCSYVVNTHGPWAELREFVLSNSTSIFSSRFPWPRVHSALTSNKEYANVWEVLKLWSDYTFSLLSSYSCVLLHRSPVTPLRQFFLFF